MKRWIAAILFCLAASSLGSSIGLAQEASPTADGSVPAGAIANDSRVFFKDGLESIEAVEFIIMTNWEMDSQGAAERFFEDLANTIPAELTARASHAQLQHRNDDQVLIAGEDQFGGPVTVVLFQHGHYVGTWMAVGDVAHDRVLADLYDEFFDSGFDPANPFPSEADLPTGYGQVGA